MPRVRASPFGLRELEDGMQPTHVVLPDGLLEILKPYLRQRSCGAVVRSRERVRHLSIELLCPIHPAAFACVQREEPFHHVALDPRLRRFPPLDFARRRPPPRLALESQCEDLLRGGEDPLPI